VNAQQQRYGAADVHAVFAGARNVLVVKGKKSQRFAAGDDGLGTAALGPTGNLRAPTLRVGKQWIVGFQEQAWAELFG
jgi:hypothetical protein